MQSLNKHPPSLYCMEKYFAFNWQHVKAGRRLSRFKNFYFTSSLPLSLSVWLLIFWYSDPAGSLGGGRGRRGGESPQVSAAQSVSQRGADSEDWHSQTGTMGCVQSKPTARRKGLISQQNDKVANNNVQVRRENSIVMSTVAAGSVHSLWAELFVQEGIERSALAWRWFGYVLDCMLFRGVSQMIRSLACALRC